MGVFQSIEKVQDFLAPQSRYNLLTLHRVNYKGQRLYIRPNPFKYFSGLTGAIDKVTFKGNQDEKRLDSWKKKFIDSSGVEAMDNFVKMTAEMGTLTHEALVTIKNDGKINWSEQRDKAETHFELELIKMYGVVTHRHQGVIDSMVYDFQKKVASLLQFFYERVDQVYSIEAPAVWEEYSVATPIDMVVNCRQTEKGDFKKTAINLKTSEQISNHHMIQVACELDMWNETYGREGIASFHKDLICECAAILRTKDWNEAKTPTFDYKYMDAVTAMKSSSTIKRKLEIAAMSPEDMYIPNPMHKKFLGETIIGEAPVVSITTLQEEWEAIQVS